LTPKVSWEYIIVLMARGEIAIDERHCKGCGYCVKFCTRGCIAQPGDRFSPQGYLLPVFSDPSRCNACGVCAWMCPDQAIEVFAFEGARA
jgi:2-oxoglutarate ferredoxin oxidoreductase subunit delta